MNKGVGVALVAVLVLVIFSVNKVYENQHRLSSPLILEVDEADIIMVPSTQGSRLTLPPDNLQRSAERYIPEKLLDNLRVQFNPWISDKSKVVTKRAIIYAKAVRNPGDAAARRLLRKAK